MHVYSIDKDIRRKVIVVCFFVCFFFLCIFFWFLVSSLI